MTPELSEVFTELSFNMQGLNAVGNQWFYQPSDPYPASVHANNCICDKRMKQVK